MTRYVTADGVRRPYTPEEEAAADAMAAVVRVPGEVTMRQARLALRAAGKLAAVAAAIDAMPSPTKEDAQIEWEYSNTLRRDHPLVAALGPALNLTGEQLDGLFITAAGL